MTRRKFFEWGGCRSRHHPDRVRHRGDHDGHPGPERGPHEPRPENIVGTPDSTIPGQKVDTGAEAKAFADVMREHTLEATGGKTYAEMGRFLDASANETNDEAAAAKDSETGEPVANGARNIWVTETALTTALNMSFMAERLAVFGIVVGVALLLTGVGFVILALGGALRRAAAEKPRTGEAIAAP